MAEAARLTLLLPGYGPLLANPINHDALPSALSALLTGKDFRADGGGMIRNLFELFAPGLATQHDLPVAVLLHTGGAALCAAPCHLHADRDRLRLFHDELQLTASECATLTAALQPLFDEVPARLSWHASGQWLVLLEQPAEVALCAPGDLEGQSITDALPRGPGARDWIRLWNTVQMRLFDLPLNQQRQANGKLAVNSLWFWGGAPLPRQWRRWDAVMGAQALLPDLCRASGSPLLPARSFDVMRGDILIVADTLDWSGDWQARLDTDTRQLFEPAARLLKRGRLRSVTLVVPGWGHHRSQASWWRRWW